MAHFLRGYDYEPEYMAEEVEAWSKAAVRRSDQWSMSWQFSRDLARCANKSIGNHRDVGNNCTPECTLIIFIVTHLTCFSLIVTFIQNIWFYWT